MSFEFHDGLLYKFMANSYGKTKRKLFYIPTSMIKSLLNAYHDNPLTGGHFATHRTLEKFKQQFWWPNMKNTIISYVKSCISCQAYNVSRQKSAGFLNLIAIPEGPNQLLGIDFCSPFPTTPHNNKYVLCLTDYFTKFIVAIALPSCSVDVTAETIFNHYICQFGVPQTIISDQGTSFKNQMMRYLSKLVGYNHIFCTAYRPQSNGAIERFNSTFVTQLAKLTDHELNNWDTYRNPVTFAYNTGVHVSTNILPFELTYGRQVHLPTDPPPTTLTFPQHHDYYQQLTRGLTHYYRTAKEFMFKQYQKTKTRYDLRRTDPQYELGTIVLTRLFTNRSKVDPRYSINPKIIVKNNHPTYAVKDINTKYITQVHVSDIRPLSSNSDH